MPPAPLSPRRRMNIREKWDVSEGVAQVLLPKRSAATATEPNTDMGVAGARIKSWTLASTNIIVTLIIGGVVGWLASILMRANGQMGILANIMRANGQMGILANIIIGITGSFLGVYVASALGVRTHGAPAAWIVAVLGAALLIWILRVLGVFSRLSSVR